MSIRSTILLVLYRYALNELWLVGSSVSSGYAKLLLVESVFTDMFFVTISLGFARFFYKHARPPLLKSLVIQTLFSGTNNLPLGILCVMSKSALLLATVLRTPSQMHAAQSCLTVIEHTAILQCTKCLFSSSERHLYVCIDKDTKH